MEIRTPEPRFVEVQLRDLEVDCGPGSEKQLTLRPEDGLEFAANGDIRVFVARTDEQLVFHAAHIRWHSLRTRVVKEPVK